MPARARPPPTAGHSDPSSRDKNTIHARASALVRLTHLVMVGALAAAFSSAVCGLLMLDPTSWYTISALTATVSMRAARARGDHFGRGLSRLCDGPWGGGQVFPRRGCWQPRAVRRRRGRGRLW